jgi:hypothetical protein
MVTRRARSVFGLCLAFALLPFVTMAAGGTTARAYAAMAWMQFQAKSQSSADLPRTGSTQTDAHHLPVTPFVPAAPLSLALSSRAPARTSFAPHALVVRAVVRLHPARAPPSLS